LHDAIMAEEVGVAATAIITDRFVATARAMAKVLGQPEYPFAIIRHPISNNNDAMLREKAEVAAQQCVEYLLQRSAVVEQAAMARLRESPVGITDG
jgi:hypothetical protein